MYVIVLMFSVLFFSTSCVVQKEIEIEVLKPSELNLSPEYKRVLLVDNTKKQLPNSGNYYKEIKLSSSLKELSSRRIQRSDTLNVDSLGSAAVFNAANNLLASDLLDTVFVWNENTHDRLKPKDMQLLSPRKVRNLADSTKTDMVISLDLFQYETEIVYSLWFNDLYELSANTQYSMIWRIYDGNTMSLLNRMAFRDTFYFDVQLYNVDQTGFLEAMVLESAWKAGELSAQKMFPWWKRVKRVYFKSGSPGLRLANRFYIKGEMDRAVVEWERAYAVSKGKDKARAAFNLALYYELSGMLEKSMEYLILARMVYDDSRVLLKTGSEYKLIDTYSDVIEKRIKEDRKLKDQLL